MKKWSTTGCLLLLYWMAVAQSTTLVRFRLQGPDLEGLKNIGIRGDVPPLSWDKTYPLKPAAQKGFFEAEVPLSGTASQILSYKYVFGDKKITWELEGQNRILVLQEGELTCKDQWNIAAPFDIRLLPPLSAAQISADYAIARKALQELHPGLWRYRSKHEMDSIFQHFDSVFNHPMSRREAFLYFSQLTAAIRCGHTFPSFYNQNSLIQEVVFHQADKLPFAFRVVDKRMIVTENTSPNASLPNGAEILSINGTPTPTLLAQTAALVKADGANDAKRYADLNTFGIGRQISAFDVYFPLLYPPVQGRYTLRFQAPDPSHTDTISVAAISIREREKRIQALYPARAAVADSLWRLTFWDAETAYLQMLTFDGFQLPFDWRAFLKDAFERIRKQKIKNLVLDIRWNEGGQDDILLYLAQQLLQKPLVLTERQNLVRYQQVPTDIKPYLSTWDNTFFDLSKQVRPLNASFFEWTVQEPNSIQPGSKAFRGKVVLLVNAANSSATFYLAEIAREHQIATLVGETTGGSQKGLNAGVMFFLRLPHSGIEIDIPIIGSFSEHLPEGGIPPDLPVAESVEDIRQGKDTVMEAVRKYLRSGQGQ